ncbi:MAG: hypothetical protein KatS3mg092_0290 [Patescibacteria group bacterium]|nr:MAG: hypothetical protein KatS3mg092_0290 [Patescibacteria group bacterium]
MRRKKTQDIIEELIQFQKSLEKKPSFEEMFTQIKMMKFRLKPIQGSLINFDFQNKKFVEILWSLGKLDEFFMKKINDFQNDEEKERFFQFFTQICNNYQEKLNKIPVSKIQNNFDNINILEVEIYKSENKKN